MTLWDKQLEMDGLGERLTPKGSGLLPAPRSGYAATVIDWDIVLRYVLKYKQNTDSCDLYLHVIMTFRPTASHSCPLLANVKPPPWNLSLGYYLS